MKFNPAKLSIARKRCMLNKKQLADKVNVDLRTIVRWEQCQSEPTTENIDAIASALGFPKMFFFGEEVDEPICEHISFRSQTAMTAAEREAALAAGQIGYMISDWVEKKFALPEAKLPDLHLFQPAVAAQMLRQEWGLGQKPISNMIQLLESKGVRVFSLAENTKHVNAYSLWRRNVPYVFLNTYKTAECSRFDAAHELAHLVLHQDGGAKGRTAEEQANRFAAAFLMPEADLLGAIQRVYDLQQLIAAKRRWKVSLPALNYRVHELGLISDWKYRGFCIEIIKREYNRHEPNGIEREVSVVWEKVLKALWADGETHFNIANDLSLPIEEVVDLLFGVLAGGCAKPPPQASELSVVPTEAESLFKA